MADEFMIVAGMPQTIGEEHVTEVAAMALDILAACLVFQVSRVTTCHVSRVTTCQCHNMSRVKCHASRVSGAAQTKQEHQSEDGVSQVFTVHLNKYLNISYSHSHSVLNII